MTRIKYSGEGGLLEPLSKEDREKMGLPVEEPKAETERKPDSPENTKPAV